MRPRKSATDRAQSKTPRTNPRFGTKTSWVVTATLLSTHSEARALEPAPPRSRRSSQRSRNGSFHDRGVRPQAHGATPIAQRGEVVASKMPHVLAAFY